MKKYLFLLTFGILSNTVLADQKNFSLPKTYIAECGSCHVAYPAQLLPGGNWNNIINNLSKHYGSDASLDSKTSKEILSYLQNNSSSKSIQNNIDNRITKLNWFKREHSEINLAKKDSFSNCSSCHKMSDTGNYSLKGYKGAHDD